MYNQFSELEIIHFSFIDQSILKWNVSLKWIVLVMRQHVWVVILFTIHTFGGRWFYGRFK